MAGEAETVARVVRSVVYRLRMGEPGQKYQPAANYRRDESGPQRFRAVFRQKAGLFLSRRGGAAV